MVFPDPLMYRFGPTLLLWGIVGVSWLARVDWPWLKTAGQLTYPLYPVHAFVGFALINRFSTRVPKYVLLWASS